MVDIENTLSAERMRLVLDVSRMLAITTDLDRLLQKIAEATCQLLGCERASIFLHDSRARQLWTKVALQSAEIRVPDNAGIVGAAFSGNQVLNVPEPYQDPRFNPANDRRTGFVTRNILAAPMYDGEGKPLGVIQAINKTAGKFGPADAALVQLLADQAGVAIQRHRLQLAALEVVGLKHEMDLAKRVQEAMIPKHPPVIPGLICAGLTHPASTTGGDVFDLWQTPDGRLGIFVGDASGHGLAPTLVVSQARTLVRALAELETDPLAILTRINARLAGDLERGRFVTAFLGFLAADGWLHYCSAGHGPMVFSPSAAHPLTLLEAGAPPLGVLDELMGDPSISVRLEPGGVLLVLSDGIFEAHNPAGEMFGIGRVCECLQSNRGNPPQQAIHCIYDLVHTWQATDDPADDQTIVLAAPTS